MWISARFLTEYMPRSLSKNARLHSTPLVVLHLFWACFSQPSCRRLWTLTTHALHLHNPINTGEKRAARLSSKHWFKERYAQQAVGTLISNELSELVILHCTNLQNRYYKSRLVSRYFLLYILGLPGWETELLERSALIISLLNYVNNFTLSYQQENTLNPYTYIYLQFQPIKFKTLQKNLTHCFD